MDKSRAADAPVTAADVMTRDIVTVHENMPASEAAKFLISKSICGAPAVDDQGNCVGFFSAVEFSRVSQQLPDLRASLEICPYQLHHRRVDGCDVTLCTLPVGQCLLQTSEKEEGHTRILCQSPHEIVVEWQSFEPRLSPTDPVKRWMSAIPVTVNSRASVGEFAARMEKAKIHSIVVVDDEQHIVGILNSLFGLNEVAELATDQTIEGTLPVVQSHQITGQ